jgi:hypothetical protein
MLHSITPAELAEKFGDLMITHQAADGIEDLNMPVMTRRFSFFDDKEEIHALLTALEDHSLQVIAKLVAMQFGPFFNGIEKTFHPATHIAFLAALDGLPTNQTAINGALHVDILPLEGSSGPVQPDSVLVNEIPTIPDAELVFQVPVVHPEIREALINFASQTAAINSRLYVDDMHQSRPWLIAAYVGATLVTVGLIIGGLWFWQRHKNKGKKKGNAAKETADATPSTCGAGVPAPTTAVEANPEVIGGDMTGAAALDALIRKREITTLRHAFTEWHTIADEGKKEAQAIQKLNAAKLTRHFTAWRKVTSDEASRRQKIAENWQRLAKALRKQTNFKRAQEMQLTKKTINTAVDEAVDAAADARPQGRRYPPAGPQHLQPTSSPDTQPGTPPEGNPGSSPAATDGDEEDRGSNGTGSDTDEYFDPLVEELNSPNTQLGTSQKQVWQIFSQTNPTPKAQKHN